MKIAIATSGKTLESQVDPRFGRCPYFLLVDSETDEFEAIENQAQQAFQGAGVTAAQTLANQEVKAVIAGNFGPNALRVLNASGIKTFGGVSGMTAQQALVQFKEGKLSASAAVPTSTGIAWGRGRGGGGSRGRGNQ
jgi:predicted Fe-Mo cluster-binding NifX family protein